MKSFILGATPHKKKMSKADAARAKWFADYQEIKNQAGLGDLIKQRRAAWFRPHTHEDRVIMLARLLKIHPYGDVEMPARDFMKKYEKRFKDSIDRSQLRRIYTKHSLKILPDVRWKK
jgi:hypothetical protein